MNSLAMNPMELSVDQPEGVALYSAAAGGKFFACYLISHFRYGRHYTVKKGHRFTVPGRYVNNQTLRGRK